MGRGGDGTNDTDEQERAAAAVTADAPPTELKRAPTKHPKSAEGGAWGCEWFDPPPSSKGEDDRWFNRHGEVVSLRNLYGTAGLYMCFTLWVIPLDLLGIFYWGISIKEAAIGFCVWYAIASLALTMNHRFFSHAAFKTSRPCFTATKSRCARQPRPAPAPAPLASPARPPARSSCTEQAADPPPSCLSPPSAAPRGLMWRTCTRRSWRTSRSSTCPRASRRCIPSASAAPLDMCRAVSGGCGPSTARARRR
jgi:hypothetical protein